MKHIFITAFITNIIFFSSYNQTSAQNADVGYASLTMNPVIVATNSTDNLIDVQFVIGPGSVAANRVFVQLDIPLNSVFKFTGIQPIAGWSVYAISNEGHTITLLRTSAWSGVAVNDIMVTYDATSTISTASGESITANIVWGDGTSDAWPGSGAPTLNNTILNDYTSATLKSLPLPVVFGNINATLANGLLKVNWTTVTEKNNDRFIIEVSKDGKVFTAIDSVKTLSLNGNSDLQLKYSIEKNLGSMTIMGIGINIYGNILVGMILLIGISLLLGQSKISRKYVSLLVIGMFGAGLVFIASCKKEDQQIKASSNTGKIFVRISQVNIDGTSIYSKVIQATNE